MSAIVYDENGAIREFWDDDTRTYTSWDAAGTVTETRPYTAEENTAADATATVEQETANKSTIELNLEEDLDAMQAIIDQTNEELRADPSQEIKEIARAARRLIRLALDDYTGTE
jgi:hypothetical protein